MKFFHSVFKKSYKIVTKDSIVDGMHFKISALENSPSDFWL